MVDKLGDRPVQLPRYRYPPIPPAWAKWFGIGPHLGDHLGHIPTTSKMLAGGRATLGDRPPTVGHHLGHGFGIGPGLGDRSSRKGDQPK